MERAIRRAIEADRISSVGVPVADHQLVSGSHIRARQGDHITELAATVGQVERAVLPGRECGPQGLRHGALDRLEGAP